MTAPSAAPRRSFWSEYRAICRAFNVRRRDFALLTALQIGGTAFEGVGLGVFVPILHLLSNGRGGLASASADPILGAIQRMFAALGLPLTLEVLLVAAVVLLFLRQVFLFLRNVVQGTMQERLKRTLRDKLFDRYMQADVAYQDRESSGSIINALTTETQITAITVLAPIMMANVAIVGAVYFAMMLVVSVSMTLVSAATMLATGLLLNQVIRRSRRAGNELADTNRRISDFLVGRVQSLRLVRLVGHEQAEVDRTHRISRDIFNIGFRIVYLGASLSVLLEPIVVAAAMAILYVGVTFFGMALAEIGFFVVILLRLLPIAKDVTRLQQQYAAGYGSMRSLFRRLVDMEQAREDRSGTKPFPAPLARGIALDGVHFDFPVTSARGGHRALRGIDLVIAAGRMTALVGPSGAGKSTLIDLLPRLRTPTQGRILVDDVPLGEIDVQALRANIAYVPQAPRIVEPTPRAHICYGAANLTAERVEEAARDAGAHEFIVRLPKGYDTMLGEEGRLLSGGERQRLDLARALARRVPILILDEPTSNLDAESEFKLQEALRRLRQRGQTTIIVIAHRLATVIQADTIVVMREGRIEASGRHARLVEISPWYMRAFAHQSGALALEAPAAQAGGG
ncbi:MAG TPA: ABC transporter ATP-binding protein [Alphaproteobacteria bacterium]|jgi:ABC-type multidrug transport system fused ATPase/permease subunit